MESHPCDSAGGSLARAAHIDQARACDQAQWLSSGQTEHRGTFGRQTDEARSRTAQFHSRRFLFGVAASTKPQSSLSFDGARSMPSRSTADTHGR